MSASTLFLLKALSGEAEAADSSDWLRNTRELRQDGQNQIESCEVSVTSEGTEGAVQDCLQYKVHTANSIFEGRVCERKGAQTSHDDDSHPAKEGFGTSGGRETLRTVHFSGDSRTPSTQRETDWGATVNYQLSRSDVRTIQDLCSGPSEQRLFADTEWDTLGKSLSGALLRVIPQGVVGTALNQRGEEISTELIADGTCQATEITSLSLPDTSYFSRDIVDMGYNVRSLSTEFNPVPAMDDVYSAAGWVRLSCKED